MAVGDEPVIRVAAIISLMVGLIVLGGHDLAAGLWKTGWASLFLAAANGLLLL